MKPTEAFLAAAADAGIAFESGELDQLGHYLALLVEANETTNLTRIVDPDDAWPRHILDALQLLALLGELPPDAKVLDVGSGGGIPAIPLAIVRPDLQFTLLEATGKKAEFLSSTAQALGLGNVNVVQDRAENAAAFRGDHRGVYHAVTARAVAPLATLVELTVPFLVEGGLLLAIKGEKAAEEIEAAEKALRELRGVVVGTSRHDTGTIVVVEKRGPEQPQTRRRQHQVEDESRNRHPKTCSQTDQMSRWDRRPQILAHRRVAPSRSWKSCRCCCRSIHAAQ